MVVAIGSAGGATATGSGTSPEQFTSYAVKARKQRLEGGVERHARCPGPSNTVDEHPEASAKMKLLSKQRPEEVQ